MSRIGVGRITCGVRALRPLLAPSGTVVEEFTDVDRRGPAYARNEVLHRLYAAGCDYFFLFDDDCYPVMPGWAEYFVAQASAHGLGYLGLPEIFKSRSLRVESEMGWWDSTVGCFNFQTRGMLEQVGHYNEACHTYGYEDSGRNDRVRRILGRGGMPSPVRASAYIHSEDVFAEHPAPNMTVEEKRAAIEANRPIWQAELDSEQLYYPYPRASA